MFMLFFGQALWGHTAVETLRCHVNYAEVVSSGGGLRGQSSVSGVMARTSNCGSFYIQVRGDAAERERVAASFGRDREYDFEVGWFTRFFARDLQGIAMTPNEYRLVEPSSTGDVGQ